MYKTTEVEIYIHYVKVQINSVLKQKKMSLSQDGCDIFSVTNTAPKYFIFIGKCVRGYVREKQCNIFSHCHNKSFNTP